MAKRLILALAVFGLLAAFAFGQSQYTIQVATAPNGVKYLADGNGMTLYYFTLDTSGQSACTGGCLQKWPAFNAGTVNVPSSLNASDFGTITRTDGSMQTTYDGWPLYYWFQDKNPGDMKGENVGGVWFIMPVPFYTVMLGTAKEAGGNYLVDAAGKTLYYFTHDSPGQSACSGGCLQKWPAFYSPSVVVPSSMNPSDFSTITRSDGSMQTTFKGYPLYYFASDANRGDVKGQGVGGIWYVVNPAKFSPGM